MKNDSVSLFMIEVSNEGKIINEFSKPVVGYTYARNYTKDSFVYQIYLSSVFYDNMKVIISTDGKNYKMLNPVPSKDTMFINNMAYSFTSKLPLKDNPYLITYLAIDANTVYGKKRSYFDTVKLHFNPDILNF